MKIKDNIIQLYWIITKNKIKNQIFTMTYTLLRNINWIKIYVQWILFFIIYYLFLFIII